MFTRKPKRFSGKVEEFINIKTHGNWKWDIGNVFYDNLAFFSQKFHGFSPLIYFKDFILEKSGKYYLIRYSNRILIQLYQEKIINILIDDDNIFSTIKILDDFIRECSRRKINLTWVEYVHPAKWKKYVKEKITF